jgi:hypothetical protein
MTLDVREEMFEGGVYAPDGERTDFYLKVGTACGTEPGKVAVELVVVTGNATFSVVDCPPEAVKRLGRWLAEVAKEAEDHAAEEGLDV